MRASSFVLGVMLAVLSASTFAAQNAAPQGDAKRGEAIFMTMGCYACHGAVGQGNGRDGPRLSPPVPYAAFLQQVRTPRLEMPAYVAASLSDSQVADIIAYLAGLPRTGDPKAIRALQ